MKYEAIIWRNYGEVHADVLGVADDLHWVRGREDGPAEIFVLWSWYLDALMESVSPGPDGWTAIALEYHGEERWRDGVWLMPDVAEAIGQLQSLDRSALERHSLGMGALGALPDLLEFLEQALSLSQDVVVFSR